MLHSPKPYLPQTQLIARGSMVKNEYLCPFSVHPSRTWRARLALFAYTALHALEVGEARPGFDWLGRTSSSFS